MQKYVWYFNMNDNSENKFVILMSIGVGYKELAKKQTSQGKTYKRKNCLKKINLLRVMFKATLHHNEKLTIRKVTS